MHVCLYQRQMTCGNLLWDNNKMQKILGMAMAMPPVAIQRSQGASVNAHSHIYTYIFTSPLLLVWLCVYGGFS